MDQATFHVRYEAMPEHVRAELIGGVVYIRGRTKAQHGVVKAAITSWLRTYAAATPAVVGLNTVTIKLGATSEPEPDGVLLLRDGATSIDVDDYLVGPPELIVDIASDSDSIDLHAKKRDYEILGVREYLVVVLSDHRAVWFCEQV